MILSASDQVSDRVRRVKDHRATDSVTKVKDGLHEDIAVRIHHDIVGSVVTVDYLHLKMGQTRQHDFIEEPEGPLSQQAAVEVRRVLNKPGPMVKVPNVVNNVARGETAVMCYLDDTAHALPVQRIELTLDGSDSIPIDMSDGTRRILRVFRFVEGVLWEQINSNVEQLTKLGDALGQMNRALRLFEHPAVRRQQATLVEETL